MVWSKVRPLLPKLQFPQHSEDVFAALLGLVLIWSWIFWLPVGLNPDWLTDRSSAICLPYFDLCKNMPIFDLMSFSAWNDLMAVAGLAILMSAALQKRTLSRLLVAVGYLIKLTIFVLDFRLMGNYHMIGFYFALLFVINPAPATLQLLFCLVYFFAGLLKTNVEWLSGSALYGEIPGLHGSALPFATGFVLVMEIFGAWLLLSRKTFARWSIFGALVTFHLLSTFVVGFFYPAVMLTLLLFFPFCWQAGIDFDFRDLKAPQATVLAIILVFQLIPTFLKYPSLTGEGRFLALNMFDAKAKCAVTMRERKAEGLETEIPNPFLAIGFRIGCDPYLYFSHLKNLCSKNPEKQYALYMQIRGNHDLFYPVMVAESNMCRGDVKYSWWQHNPWIQISDATSSPSSVSWSSLFQRFSSSKHSE